METPPSLRKFIAEAQERGEKSMYMETIYLNYFKKVIKEQYPQAKLTTEGGRTDVPRIRVTLKFPQNNV